MVLNPEWRRRIDHWRNYLPKIFYRAVGDVALEHFVTSESMRPAEAQTEFSGDCAGDDLG